MDVIQDLIRFLKNPTPFHVIDTILALLKDEGVFPLKDHLEDRLEDAYLHERKYYVASEGTVIIFRLPKISKKEWQSLESLPLRLWGAHTDSPTLKIKPQAIALNAGHVQLGVEVYGGAILNTWLDRPLAVAGRIFTSTENGVQSHLFDSHEPQVVIPNAAIHLNRNINKDFSLTPDTHLPAFWTGGNADETWLDVLPEKCGVGEKNLSHDLFLYDPQKPTLLGREKSLLNSSRLDNLAMVHAGLQGWLRAEKEEKAKKPFLSALAFFNHEEIGSLSYEGASSSFLKGTLDSLYRSLLKFSPRLDYILSRKESFFISADMAHGFHPSYETWYESQHRPILNGGPVIKYNASYRYTSSGHSAAKIKHLLFPDLPVQEYLHSATIPCGTTIGPIVSSQLAIPAVDIGSPLWAMHSLRETTGVKDHLMMIELAERFFKGK